MRFLNEYLRIRTNYEYDPRFIVNVDETVLSLTKEFTTICAGAGLLKSVVRGLFVCCRVAHNQFVQLQSWGFGEWPKTQPLFDF